MRLNLFGSYYLDIRIYLLFIDLFSSWLRCKVGIIGMVIVLYIGGWLRDKVVWLGWEGFSGVLEIYLVFIFR